MGGGAGGGQKMGKPNNTVKEDNNKLIIHGEEGSGTSNFTIIKKCHASQGQSSY